MSFFFFCLTLLNSEDFTSSKQYSSLIVSQFDLVSLTSSRDWPKNGRINLLLPLALRTRKRELRATQTPYLVW